MIWIVLAIAIFIGWRWKRWRGVAIVAATAVGIMLLATFSLLFLGGQVSTILSSVGESV